MGCKEPQQAFEEALADGRLSRRATAWNYAAHFMYMGPDAAGRDMFKHCATRRYLGAGNANNEIQAFNNQVKITGE